MLLAPDQGLTINKLIAHDPIYRGPVFDVEIVSSYAFVDRSPTG